MKCLTCEKESANFEVFMDLTLPIVKKTNCSLSDCLSLFLEPEQLNEDSNWFCPVCKQLKKAAKKIEIWKLPKLLIIHLKRFRNHVNLTDKIETMVDYPLENLSFENFAINKPTKNYHLYAISIHKGNLEGGHYISFCHHSLLKKWFKFDDTVIEEIQDASTLKTSDAYILFYSQ